MRLLNLPIGLALVAAPFICLSAQVSDVTPPQLQAVAISPTAVDVSASSKTVTVDMGVTDNLSGIRSVTAILEAPNGTFAQSVAASVDGFTYRATLTIPRYAANGTWLLYVTLIDNVSNRSDILPTMLQTRGLPFSISVTSTPVDVTPPVPVSISFSPSTVDVSSQAQNVTVQVRVNDDLSGVYVDPTYNQAFSFILQSPSGQQIRLSNPDFVVTGTPAASLWQATFQVPRYAEAAMWSVVSLRVADAAGNIRFLTPTNLANAGVTTQLGVTSAVSDLVAPVMTRFSFTPTVINTALGPQTVNVKLDLTDDLSGVSFTDRTYFNRLFFTSPSGQSVAAFKTGFTRTSGDVLRGTWETNMVFPQFSEAGTWDATFLRLEDATYNLRFFNAAGIRALGFGTSLTVIRPSLVVDGSLGTSGGVVQDQTFGSRAEVIAPAGVLPGPITVAIDALTSSVNIPMPTGFETNGSLYVNIELTPNPSPLAAPGLTLVLPLPSPQPPGLLLALEKIDPTTGKLIAALDANNAPIYGVVGADGQSAAFSGVVRFSTFVGLLPERRTVQIAVKPGDGDTAPINLKSNGVTPVAVLSSADFDAADVDPETVTFAGAVAQRSTMEDVNGDGLPDRVFQFATQDLKLSVTDTQATLDGRTFGGLRVRGTAAIRVR
jgi:hypothetical protein